MIAAHILSVKTKVGKITKFVENHELLQDYGWCLVSVAKYAKIQATEQRLYKAAKYQTDHATRQPRHGKTDA